MKRTWIRKRTMWMSCSIISCGMIISHWNKRRRKRRKKGRKMSHSI